MALTLPNPENHHRTCVVITDGIISLQGESLPLNRERAQTGSVFAVGGGREDVHLPSIERIAQAGRTEPFVVRSPMYATVEAAARRLHHASRPVLSGGELSFGEFEA